ncbi:MAG: hypothetical protein Q9219_000245 [cf. Caloplaca sp. 3 TL-2023]
MPLPKTASSDSLHRHNCAASFRKTPPKAWEFLFYIPNPNHPIADDGDCSAHFCLVLPDAYKRPLLASASSASSSCRKDNDNEDEDEASYRAVALVTRRPRWWLSEESKRRKEYLLFRPHTAECTCPPRMMRGRLAGGELGTAVVNRVGRNNVSKGGGAGGASSKVITSPCHQYSRTDKANRGHFETWSWYDDSVIPVQAPKMVHIECLHLKRPLTQPRFGLVLEAPSVVRFEEAFKAFCFRREISSSGKVVVGEEDHHLPNQVRCSREVGAGGGGGVPRARAWGQDAVGVPQAVMSRGIGV